LAEQFIKDENKEQSVFGGDEVTNERKISTH
jgi:hypothetical protein